MVWIFQIFKVGRGVVAFLLCLLFSVFLMRLEPGEKELFHEVAVGTVLAPVQSIFLIQKKYFLAYRENEELKKYINAIRVEIDGLNEASQENKRLKKLLQFKKEVEYKLQPARIISRDPSRFEHSWLIDLGKSDSVERDMAVMTPKGVVGKIAKVFEKYSIVQLIQDPNFKVSVLSRRSRAAGILESHLMGNVLARFSVHSDVQLGDTLVTSGLGGVFPKGLAIGRVAFRAASDKDVLDFYEVELFQLPHTVEEVFVYLRPGMWSMELR